MIVTTLESIAGRVTEATLGAVRGTASWTKRVTKSSVGGIRSMEVHGLADLNQGLNEAKELATREIEKRARALGADAVVGLRLEVIEMNNAIFCVNASGTAVRTMTLPQSVPSYSEAGGSADADDGFGGFDLPALMAMRPSFEGSVMRH